MVDPTRRRKMRYDRVLIEAERILSPQFDDGVLYFTGAQIELMRNVTQYLRRLETYVSEYHAGYYITPAAEDYDELMAIVADLEEVLMGNPNTIWGYADRWSDEKDREGIGGGYTWVETDPVPEGYVYVLEHWSIWHTDTVTRGVYLWLRMGSDDQILYRAPSLSGYDYVIDAAN